jgi:thiamine transport system permease protein
LSLGLIAMAVGGAVTALLGEAGQIDLPAVLSDPYIRRVTLFTFWQALLSTLLSVGLAIPVARAFARRGAFVGRGLLLRLFSLSLVIPSIVAIFGIVAVHGRNGWVNGLLESFGLDGGHYLYGLTGILIAHIFFNLPLATRILLIALEAIPPEYWRLAAQIGMRPRDSFRWIEWPALRQVLPAAAGLVFMLCFISFAVVLTLGGGPRATTIEVAIYQALRFDFDIARAVALSVLQVVFAVAVVLMFLRFVRQSASGPTERRPFSRPDAVGLPGRLGDGLALFMALCLVVMPLAATAFAGFNRKFVEVMLQPALWLALLQTLLVAVSAGLLALVLAAGILLTSRGLRRRGRLVRAAIALETAGSLVLVFPPFVLAAGLFVLLRAHVGVFGVGIYIVILINAFIALPFVIRILGEPMMRLAREQDKLCLSLGIAGWRRFYLIDWPNLRRAAGLALAIAATLSAGDLSVIALFGSQNFTTLPLLLYQRMSSYRMEEAAVVAVLLTALCFMLFLLLERLLGGPRRA